MKHDAISVKRKRMKLKKLQYTKTERAKKMFSEIRIFQTQIYIWLHVRAFELSQSSLLYF